MGVVIAHFSKIEARLRALSVRFYGTPEEGLKAFIYKALEDVNETENHPLFLFQLERVTFTNFAILQGPLFTYLLFLFILSEL